MDSNPQPDDKRLFHLFRQCGMDEDGAYTAVQEIRTMAGQNVIAEMKAMRAEWDAQVRELRAEQSGSTKELRAEVGGVTKELRAEIRSTYRTLGYLIAAVGGFLAALHIVIQLLE